MKNRYDDEDLERLRNKLTGWGEKFFRKSYYPELQECLQQSEKVRTLLDQSNDAIFLLHMGSKTIADVNESACIQLEYSREELFAMSIDSLFELPEEKCLMEKLLTAVSKDKPQIFNTRLLKKNGSQIPAEVTIRLIVLDNMGYAVAVARDITERQQAEQKLQEQYREMQATCEELSASYEEIEALSGEVEDSYNNLIAKNMELTSVKERLELALWGASAGMWDWYIQTGDLIFNERYAEIHGYRSGELPFRLAGWEARINPEDWPYVEENLYSHIDGKLPYFEAEYRIKNKTGGWIWIQDNGRVVSWDEKGKPLRVVGIIQEITRRKETELALKESEQRYHEVFENTSDGIFLIDLAPEGRFCYVGCNPEMEKLMGVSSSHIDGKTPQELFPPEVSPNLNRNYRRCVDTRSIITYTQVLHLPPVLKHFHTTLIPVSNAEGNIYRIIGINRDITERLKAEEAAQMEEVRFQLEQEKAARYEAQAMKMTTISAMSAGVVHEISQPLNALKVLADGMLYRREVGHHINMEEAFDTFTKISAQTERINEIIRHMRNLTSFDYNDPTSFSDLNTAVNESMKILGRQLEAHGIKVNMDLDSSISRVWGHEQHLVEIIINLIVNAMHAVEEQQQEDKMIKCTTRQEDDQVILEIADNGPGISEEIGDKIWEPFFSTRKGGKGMGLGLAIIQSIISRGRGSITYYSNNWGGATFRVIFPAHDQNLSRIRDN